ncbi:hypothetical protein [Rhodoferax sp.]|jgi:hypothetical protein|uniref:hypothetical protein n=1 Tax=Rhodoferax sp. TaxID=50421 RepID=UPI0027200E87|nr:hypothetical protein [Rhodoferax sp.]MDO9145777.1 hypothetical protein [Rhodoferax sp.]MDP1527926.1 hypothetical protein [Rhodoferax sp.]MDP1944461.1 hypothetical protein [Rhodoferax sp.]MDP2441021.1 hypothetical protein [Rhodoferax sp.]MDP3192133.1 hypothetical protein [Rhodoferax sp.]
MEYSYADIEASIRRAQALRAQALADFLSVAYSKSAQWISGLIEHKVQRAAAAARSSTSPVF